jgi:hypothetical protein
VKPGTAEHPPHKTSEASAIGNHLKPAMPGCFMRATLDVCVLFASTIAQKPGRRLRGGGGRCPARIPSKQAARLVPSLSWHQFSV